MVQIEGHSGLVRFLRGFRSWSGDHQYDFVAVVDLLGACLDNLRQHALAAELEDVEDCLSGEQKLFVSELCDRVFRKMTPSQQRGDRGAVTKTVADPDPDSLADLKGCDVRLWKFHPTFNRLALLFSRSGEPEVAYLVAVGCTHLKMPTRWSGANVSVSYAWSDGPEPQHCIVDEDAGVEMVCSSVILLRPSEGEVTDSLDFLELT